MKLMFVSDVHGSKTNLKRVKEIYDEECPDKIIFLGDLFYNNKDINGEIENILMTFDNKILIKGNNDSIGDIFTSSLEFVETLCFTAFNKRFFCSHGHVYNIYRQPDKNFDVLVYGHTHQGMVIKDGQKYFLNPGSISIPRFNSVNSYMIVDDFGIYLKDLDKNIIKILLW